MKAKPQAQPAHTPTPWRVVQPLHGQPTEYLCVQIGKDKLYTTLELKPADAELIVTAVNACEAHRETIQALTEALEAIAEGNPDFNHAQHCVEHRRIARKALAQASSSAPHAMSRAGCTTGRRAGSPRV